MSVSLRERSRENILWAGLSSRTYFAFIFSLPGTDASTFAISMESSPFADSPLAYSPSMEDRRTSDTLPESAVLISPSSSLLASAVFFSSVFSSSVERSRESDDTLLSSLSPYLPRSLMTNSSTFAVSSSTS